MKNDFILNKAAYYHYDLLSVREKELYKIMLGDLLSHRKETKINDPTCTVERLTKVLGYILKDRPDIFWIGVNYVYRTVNNVITGLTYKYAYTEQETLDIINRIVNSNFYRELDRKLAVAKTQFDKALLLYEYIIKHCEYDKVAQKAPDRSRYRYADSLEGVCVRGRAVCTGYSKTFQYFASRHNMRCMYVTGKTHRGPHAWNLININGQNYYVDVTWGDPTFRDGKYKDPNFIDYNYFCITTADLKKTHGPTLDIAMPLCTSEECNYFRRMGMLESNYSWQNVAAHILRDVKLGNNEILIKYTSVSAYRTAKYCLLKQGDVYKALKAVNIKAFGYKDVQIRYSNYDENNILKIILVRL